MQAHVRHGLPPQLCVARHGGRSARAGAAEPQLVLHSAVQAVAVRLRMRAVVMVGAFPPGAPKEWARAWMCRYDWRVYTSQ